MEAREGGIQIQEKDLPLELNMEARCLRSLAVLFWCGFMSTGRNCGGNP